MGQARVAMWKLLVMNDLITKLSTNKESPPSTATSGPLQEMFILEHLEKQVKEKKE